MTGARLVAGGLAGGAEERAFARVCCWCDIPHPIGLVDRQLLDQDAQITHGMCEAAEARLNAELARAIEEEREREIRAWRESVASGGALSVQDVLDNEAEAAAEMESPCR